MTNTHQRATKLIKDMNQLFTDLHDEGNTGIPSAIIQEIQAHYDHLIKDRKAKQIQKITDNEETTQKIMDELFGSYGIYEPLKEKENH